jgi:hypothetical protein
MVFVVLDDKYRFLGHRFLRPYCSSRAGSCVARFLR